MPRHKWWASICSMHQRYDPDCNLCRSGGWYELDPNLVDTYKAIGVRVEEMRQGELLPDEYPQVRIV